jgi:hypothetical protein
VFELGCGVLAHIRKRWRCGEPFAAAHGGNEEAARRLCCVMKGQDVVCHLVGIIERSVHLLASRPRRFSFRAFAPRASSVLLELVDAIQVGRVRAGVQFRSDSEAVDGCFAIDEVAQGVFVQIAAGKDGDVLQLGMVKDGAHVGGLGGEVSTVDAHAFDLDSALV